MWFGLDSKDQRHRRIRLPAWSGRALSHPDERRPPAGREPLRGRHRSSVGSAPCICLSSLAPPPSLFRLSPSRLRRLSCVCHPSRLRRGGAGDLLFLPSVILSEARFGRSRRTCFPRLARACPPKPCNPTKCPALFS